MIEAINTKTIKQVEFNIILKTSPFRKRGHKTTQTKKSTKIRLMV